MERQTDMEEMLDLIAEPAFFTRNHIITKLNEAASRIFLRKGLSEEMLVDSCYQELQAFSGGVLYLTLSIHGRSWGAAVTKIGETNVFVLDQLYRSKELRILSLAARELRAPLANAILAAQKSETDSTQSNSRLNQSLNQLLRIISNMSDASGINPMPNKELRYIDALFRECAEKAAAFVQHAQMDLQYNGLSQDILCLVDWQQLERAALNMISNAIKFSSPDSAIRMQLQVSGNLLRFSVTDSGSGIPDALQQTLFQRYRREPVIEDGRHGIGLGMLFVCNAAASHGGTVLIDHPNNGGTRVTLTIAIKQESENALHSNRMFVDYAGELDHMLIELSDCLPTSLY